MLKKMVTGLALVLILMANTTFAAGTDQKQVAVNTAAKWVALIDAGNYAASWQEAAVYFKGGISREKWEQTIQRVRNSLGATISRKPITAAYKTTLPGMPDGEYVIIQYQTTFQNKKSAIEIITAMLDKDGQWRVAGYFIK